MLEKPGHAAHVDGAPKAVERFLARPDIHRRWEHAYRTAENEPFFEEAFDYIARLLNAPRSSTVLDAGCGSCAHAIRLAQRGFLVRAVDCSESVLHRASIAVHARGLEDTIRIHCANLVSLPFRDGAFRDVLCWGVLMHVPDVEHAFAELVRVLRPGGTLVLSEGNMYSLQSLIRLAMKRCFKLGTARVKRTPAGIEYWYHNADGTIMTRNADIGWIMAQARKHGLIVKKRVAGQFTDLYTGLPPGRMRRLVHTLNRVWFTYIKLPYLASGNLLILQKDAE